MLKINVTTFKRNNVAHVTSLIFLDRLETPIPIEEFALSTPPPTTHSGKSLRIANVWVRHLSSNIFRLFQEILNFSEVNVSQH